MNIPLVDSHRHLSGSISPEIIWEVIKNYDQLDIASSLDDVRQQVCLIKKDINFDYFCTRFDILNKIDWTDDVIDYVAKRVCSLLKEERIQHSTLTVSLNKFVTNDNFTSAGERVFDALNRASASVGIGLSYLLSINYNWPIIIQTRMLQLIESLGNMVAGVDFVSNEFDANWSIYPELLKPWHKQGKVIRAHVGERLGTCHNIQVAIEDLHVSRIAHGIYATPEQWEIAAKNNIIFDVSIHSNIYTNAIGLKEHPINQMLACGCQIALGTDDPVQFNCTLNDEYHLAEVLGANKKRLYKMAIDARIR
jgi:adenosine deaminase